MVKQSVMNKQEEFKQKTLEEAAENWLYELENTNPMVVEKRYPLIPMKFGFIEGAKWQSERMYSEEDMKSFGQFCADYDYRCWGKRTQEEMLQIWLEEFKKK